MIIRERIRKYYNLKRSKGPTLKKGDRVYLFYGNIKGHRNIKSKQPYDKLDFGKKGPYLIEEEIYQDIYRLRLPKKSRAFLIIHVSLLKPTPDNIPLATDEVEREG